MRRIIFYSDGSCRPNPGVGGWGMHGYLFDTELKIKKTASPAGFKITDKGYLSKEQSMLVEHTIVCPIEYYDASGYCGDNTTNNVTELLAVYNILLFTSTHDLAVSEIHIHIDSNYVLNGLGKILSDVKWSSETNSDIWTKVKEITAMLTDLGIDITPLKIAAHSNNYGNDIADKRAMIGGLLKNEKVSTIMNITEAPKYSRNELSNRLVKYPLLHPRSMVFSTDADINYNNNYCILDHDSKLPIGKFSSTSTYILTILDDPISIIEDVKLKQRAISANCGVSAVLKLSDLLKKDVMQDYTLFGTIIFTKANTNLAAVRYLDKQIVSKVIVPPGISFKAVQVFSMLHNIAYSYKDANTIVCDKMDIKDDVLVEDVINRKTNKIRVNVNGKKHWLVLGKDLPTLNIIQKIKRDPKLTIDLVLWQSEDSKRYATVITTNNTVSVWSNFDSSIII